MNMIKLNVPVNLANLGIFISTVDKVSMYAALSDFNNNSNNIENISQMPIYKQYWINKVDLNNEIAEIAVTPELFQALGDEGVAGGLCVAFACNLSPIVTAPLWRVNSIEQVLLTVSCQAPLEDFLSEEKYTCSECACGECSCGHNVKEE